MRKSVELKRFCIQTKANVFPPMRISLMENIVFLGPTENFSDICNGKEENVFPIKNIDN